MASSEHLPAEPFPIRLCRAYTWGNDREEGRQYLHLEELAHMWREEGRGGTGKQDGQHAEVCQEAWRRHIRTTERGVSQRSHVGCSRR